MQSLRIVATRLSLSIPTALKGLMTVFEEVDGGLQTAGWRTQGVHNGSLCVMEGH